MDEWHNFVKRIFSLATKIINTLFYALDKNNFNWVSPYNTAYVIWHILEVTYKDICIVKESKINLLVLSYEIFKINLSKYIGDIYIYFMDIINRLKSLNINYTNLKLVSRILRSLPKGYDPKVIIIWEDKNLYNLSLKKLIISIYEMIYKTYNEEGTIRDDLIGTFQLL